MFRNILFVVFSLVSAILLYPVLIIIVLFVFLYLQIVNIIVNWKNPTCSKRLAGLSGLLAGPDPYNSPISTLVPYVLLAHKATLEHVSQAFNETVLKPNHYPELKQRLIRKWGYYFWQDVENFCLENHIRYLHPSYPEKPILRNELREEGDKLVYKNFDERYSPWEMIIVPNVFDPDNQSIKSAIIFRTNHCMMDGLSIIKLFEKTATRPFEWPKAKTFARIPKRNILFSYCHSALVILKVLFTGPGYCLKTYFSNESNQFIKKATHLCKNSEVQWKRSRDEPQRTSKAILKRIACLNNVCLSSVITTIAVAGILKFMEQKCKSGFTDLPKNIAMQLALPLPSHPNAEFVNRWTPIRLTIPVQDYQDPVHLLKYIHLSLRNVANSAEPIVNYIASCALGLFPAFLLQKSGLDQTVSFSNFPGAKSPIDMFGYTVVDGGCLVNEPPGSAFVIMAQIIYHDFWIEVMGTNTLMKNQGDMLFLEKCIQDVVRQLDKQSSAYYEV